MTRYVCMYAVSLCVLLCASLASAQSSEEPARALLERPRPSQGYYYSAGVHGGMLNVRDQGDSVGPLGGYSVALHIGQAVTTWMDLGLAIEVGSVLADERTGRLVSFGFDWTLRSTSEVFLRLSGSIGASNLSAAANSDNKANTFGSVVGLTLGYAWFPFHQPRDSGGFALSPVLRVSAVQPVTSNAAYWTLAGFEVSWWSGLPKRQLDVPLKDAFRGGSER